MELRLSKLVDSLMRLADVRNLDDGNPVILIIKSELGEDTMIIVSYFEPYMGRYPYNVSWLDANPSSANYRQIFKRLNKLPDDNANTQHSWTALFYYDTVFDPPQFYDATDDAGNVSMQQILAHVNDHVTNPHNITAEQTHSLALSGGVMLGNLILQNSFPALDYEAVPKLYVDNTIAPITDHISSIDALLNSVSDTVTAIHDTTLPQLTRNDATLSLSLNGLDDRVHALESINLAGVSQIASIVDNVTALQLNDLSEASALNAIHDRLLTLENTDIGELSRLLGIESVVTGLVTDVANIKTQNLAFNAFMISVQQALTVIPRRFVHVQSISSANWIVTHSLNSSNPATSIIVNGEIINADSILIQDANTLLVKFNRAIKGTIIVLA